MGFFGQLRKSGLGISPRETTFAVRGFPAADSEKQAHLERVGSSFVVGYNAALSNGRAASALGQSPFSRLTQQLHQVDLALQGFAFEGAAMGLALLDGLWPWGGGRLAQFLQGPGLPHSYMVHVGAGWAAARIPWARRNLMQHLTRLDSLMKWLAVDGFGFHECFFHWRRVLTNRQRPAGLEGYALHAFDQGLGRSMWFVLGADVPRITAQIAQFSPERRSHLYSGVGLACTYACGGQSEDIAKLVETAAEYRPWLAQGSAFAAKARQRAGNMTPNTERTCQIVCETTADQAATLTDTALADLPQDTSELPAYECWRRRIAEALAVGNITVAVESKGSRS